MWNTTSTFLIDWLVVISIGDDDFSFFDWWVFPSLIFSVSLIVPNWYVVFKAPYCFRKRTTSPFLISCSLYTYLVWCISLGTWTNNQFSNQALNISSLSWRNKFGLLVMGSRPVRVQSLSYSRHNLFGFIRSSFLGSLVIFIVASGRSLTEIKIPWASVSKCRLIIAR